MSDPLYVGVGIGTTVGTATIDTAGEFTIVAHGLVDGQPVRLDALTGGAIGVFLEDTTYYVVNAAADTFDLVSIPGDTVITLGSSGGADVHTAVPHYSAPELRRADAVTLFGGTADAFGARQGVRPGHTPVSVSGTTWTVEHLTAVVYPGLASTDGPYRVQHPSESGSLDPADGSNDRIDALDLQIQDDDTDASGFRRARVVYVAGTPGSGTRGAATPNSLELATILVPSGGTPSPSIATLAQWTVASGGILPVRDDTERPSSGLYSGMATWRQDEDRLEVYNGSSWLPIGSPTSDADFVGSPTVEVADTDGDKALGAAVTIDVGPLGIVIITWNVFVDPTTGSGSNIMEQWVQATGANSFETRRLRQRAGELSDGSGKRFGVDIVTGRTPGSTTFTLFGSMSTNAYDVFDQKISVVTF